MKPRAPKPAARIEPKSTNDLLLEISEKLTSIETTMARCFALSAIDRLASTVALQIGALRSAKKPAPVRAGRKSKAAK